ncbi:MAG: class I SAM-dependent methyltransferase [Thermoplasmata archaeon]|nr:class I SAM-dependent methyltransferase [Thermoplasmata archaeon]
MREWEKIAESFDETRRYAWKECIDFIENAEGMGIDIGCGNGRHLKLMENRGMAAGIDIAFNMLLIAKKKSNALLVQADAIHLPFPSHIFDYALFIAALHNIKGRENRIKALKEMNRVLKKNGTAIISVWSKWQDRWRRHFMLQALYKWREFGDIYIPWKRGEHVERFYHLYGMRELKKDVKKAGFEIIKAWSVKKVSKKHADNHFIIVRKI